MRLLTRSDFDGICCAVLLKELGVIGKMEYAHPKDMQDGKIPVTKDDVLANVPYVEGCGLWFDHHSSENERLEMEGKFEGRSAPAPSAARVIADHYGSDKIGRFGNMLAAVDKVDSAQLTKDEILDPQGWVLLGFICDPRTGLGYHKGYRISNLEYMQELVEHLRKLSIDEILALPDTQERIARYRESNSTFSEFLKSHSKMNGPIVITDTRNVADIPPGNRFLIYSLFPEANIELRLINARGGEKVAISLGHSILNRTSNVDVGSLMLKYGGGGHKKVGTCQISKDQAEKVFGEITEAVLAS